MDKSKETKAILKLTKDTIDNKVEWSIGSKRGIVLGSEEEIIDNLYVTEYHGRSLRLYHYRDKHYTDYLEYVWQDGYRLEVVDDNDNSLWIFPMDQAIYGLYDTVREKTSDIKDFLDNIIDSD
jgi:hypothetical protein